MRECPPLARVRLRSIGAVAGLWLAGRALAADTPSSPNAATDGAALATPVEVGAGVPAARSLGRGTMRFFGLEIYQARLWAGPDFAAGRYDAHAFALVLQYARKLEGAAIAERSLAEMRRVSRLDEVQARAWQAAMTRAFPDVVPGDRLTGVHQPGQATRFYFNGRPTETVNDPAFGRLFFGIWLAASTSEPGLRQQLIGPAS